MSKTDSDCFTLRQQYAMPGIDITENDDEPFTGGY
jgi:hypothetical protein